MTNKRKSMNTGDDVHALAPEVRSRRFICDQRVSGMLTLSKICVWCAKDPACTDFT